MKKKLILLALVTLSLVTFAACGKKKEEAPTLKEDFIELVQVEIPEAEKNEIAIMTTYNNYFKNGSEIDTGVLLSDLENNIIPKYEEFLKQVQTIETDFDEVKAVKDQYYTAMDYQLKALNKVKDALKEEEADYQAEAGELLKKAEEEYDKYLAAVNDIAMQNNITIKNSSDSEETSGEEASSEEK